MDVNGKLSPREHAEMRDLVLAGSQRIKPAGAHRAQFVAGAVALVLIGAVTGGAITAALRGGEARPAPIATQSVAPTPSPSATPTPTEAPVALGGDCSALLTEDDVSEILGGPGTQHLSLTADDPAVLGGISCAWRTELYDGASFGAAVYPIGVVPESVASRIGVVPECISGPGCEYAQRFGDAWVYAWGSTADQVVRAVEIMGPRAAAEPGTSSGPRPGNWAAPSCDELRVFAGSVLDRDDLTPYVGDAHPQGMEWDILSGNSAAAWCESLGNGDGNYTESIEVLLGPGRTEFSAQVLDEAGATPVEVPGARAAWISVDDSPNFTRVFALAEGNAIVVRTRFLDQETLVRLTASLIEYFESVSP